ncbi:metal ABC transporter permease [bacterium]|nr:metal ABC transporter permease [bacterium]
MQWMALDTWIVVVGALCAMSCALLGNYLVLRRMSMMGDAISHAVLPGLAAAYLLTGSRDSVTMFAGAAVVGVLTALLVQGLYRLGRLEEGAAMGVVFTSLFALGLILLRQAADHVDLDPGCVLYGAVELSPLDTIRLWGWDVPRAAIVNGATLACNALFVLLFYKELRLSSFDPALATALGINAQVMHYLLMTLVAATAVAAFESVGSILVIAMLIVPPATAYLLTRRLGVMIGLSLVLAALSALLGHLSAITVPGWFGFSDTSTAAMMAVAAGAIFSVACFAKSCYAWGRRGIERMSFSLRSVGEDVLAALYRRREAGDEAPVSAGALRAALARPGWTALALWDLARRRAVTRLPGGYALTPAGLRQAEELVRSHRLWETFLVNIAGQSPADAHGSAMRVEHVIDAAMQSELARQTGFPELDPHAKPIPRGSSSGGEP